MEQWVAIPGWEQFYEVSDRGRVRSLSRTVPHLTSCRLRLRERILKQVLGNGYFRVSLNRNGRAEIHKVHRLVMLAFVGPLPSGMVTRHVDGDSTNNALANLVYGHTVENLADQEAHGTRPHGETKAGSKLADADIPRIRQMLAARCPQKAIAKEFGVNPSVISRIASRRAWSHVP